jgi:putative peptidoglycan lipid II flippase
MVKKLIDIFSREIKGLHEAAYLLAFFAFFSQFLALIRDRLFASKFGASEILDVYYAAFRIPDFIFTIIIALVSVSVLIPFLVKVVDYHKKEKESFINSVFSSLIYLALSFSIIAFVFTPVLLNWLFPEIVSGDLILLTRIMLLQPILLSLSGFFSSFVQVFGRFFIYALSPILYNVGIILGILFFYPVYGIKGLAWGVVFGALLHLLIQVPIVFKNKIYPKFILKPDFKIIKSVLKISVPRTIAITGNQIAMLALVSLAGIMVTGSISVFTFAFNLQSVPMAIIGVSYSLAAFPTLSKLFAKGEQKEFLDHIVRATKHIIFWSIPITVLFIVLRAQIVRVILGSGEFSWSDTRLVAAALALFSISVVAQSLILLFVRAYYSTGETKKPLTFSLISVLFTITSAFGLYKFYQASPAFVAWLEDLLRVVGNQGSVVLVLPLAFSMGQILYILMLWISFDKKFKCFSNVLQETVFHSVFSSLIIGIVTYFMLQIFDDIFDLNTLVGVFNQGFFSGIIGILAGMIVLIAIGNKEIRTVGKTLHSKVWKAKVFVLGE